MTRKVLLDTNLLIGAFDPEPGNAVHASARKRFEAMLLDPDVKLAISPLIRYEVLRGAKNVPVADLVAVLNDFHEFDVRAQEAVRASELFRAARTRGVTLDKRTFDLFHCVCAELNDLEFESEDGDVPKIQALMRDLIK